MLRPFFYGVSLWPVLFHSILLPRKGGIPYRKRRTFRNPVINAGVVTMNERRIDAKVTQYMSRMCLNRYYLKTRCARVWVAKKRMLLVVWFRRMRALLFLIGARNDKLRMPRFGDPFLLAEKHLSHSVDTKTSKLSSRSGPLISSYLQPMKRKCLFLRAHATSCMFSTLQLRSAHWQRNSVRRVKISVFSVFVWLGQL